jgi:16S rRNA (cytosine967-C5)-methyltransferase
MTKTDPARSEAVRLLSQVEAGSRLEPLLEALDQRLDRRDRRFVHELSAGTLQWRSRLDWILNAFSKRPVDSLSPSVRQILRLGTYQLLWLNRVPQRAAVHTAVDLARHHGHAGVASFVNAVLRRVSAEGGRVEYPSRDDDPVAYLATYHSHPPWLVSRWLARWGGLLTEALLKANNRRPSLYVRPHPQDDLPQLLAALPASLGAIAVDGRPGVCELTQPDGFFDSEPFQAGRCYVQDINAALGAELLAPDPGDRILDACAAPGGKAVQLANAGSGPGFVTAVDMSRSRLQRLRDNALRLRLSQLGPCVADATAGPYRSATFDRVLVDVPCSGTGILGRHPDARWRKNEADLPRQSARQMAILESAYEALRPGGVVVYSTCSLEEEENDAVVDRFLARHADVELEPASVHVPGVAWARRTVQTLPGREPGDGAYAARLRKPGAGEPRP